MASLDLTNNKFGRLTAIKRAVNSKQGSYWLCKCICGKFKEVFIGHLRAGKIKRCGCITKENIRIIGACCSRKTHGLSRTPEHTSWCAMRNRCLSKKTNGYKNYGGAGVKICDRWDSFENFMEDMGKRPTKEHTLDRIEVFGDYEPSNCRWATRQEQIDNKRCSKIYTIGSKVFRSSAVAGKEFGVSSGTILRWCKGGIAPKSGIICNMVSAHG